MRNLFALSAGVQKTLYWYLPELPISGEERYNVAATYAPEFMCVRVADEGGFVQLTREQMLAFWNATSSPPAGQPGTHSIPTQKTTIHYAEALGDTGFVLLTRIKNIGNGWEPMFYSLVWKRQDSNWRLLREFVHQKSIPKQSLK
jgi:hypothetical protein